MPAYRAPNRDQINELIKVPSKLVTEDGVELKITRWTPDVSISEGQTVTVEARLFKPRSSEGDRG